MAIKEFNVDLDIKGRVLASIVPNSTGSIVTWNATTNVFGLRTNAQIISDLNLSSNFVPYTGATADVNLGTRSITSTGGFIGNASTATTLATSRTINGTSFNGSANITTARWGTARNITIGNTTKAVNGSANVSWSLAEIGAASQSSLGNYLPLSGGTLYSTAFDLLKIKRNHETFGSAILFSNNTANSGIRIGFGSTIGFMVEKESSTAGTGDLLQINSSTKIATFGGQINTPSHGNSSQWKQAYDWGDFRDYGLGRVSWGNTNGFEDIDANTGTQLRSIGGQLFGITSTNRPIGFIAKGVLNTRWSWMGVTDQGPIRIYATNSTSVNDYVEIYHTGNISSALSGYVQTSRTITAGNGLTGGGSLAANRTITLGTPGAITLSSTNSVQSSSHTHAFNPGGTTAQYIRGDGTLATFPTNQDSIFAYSPQGGLYTTNWASNALGQYSLAIGHASNATAQNSTAVGSAVFTGGFGSTNVGFSSNVNKSLAGNFGTYNTNNHRESFTYGLGLQSASTWQTVIGRYNRPMGAGDIDDWTNIRNPIFVIGVGQDEMNRKNAVSAFGDGRLDYEYNRDDTYWHQNTIPDIKWIQENISGGGGGGGTGGAATHIYTDSVVATHDFNGTAANGLVSDIGLVAGTPLFDFMYGAVGVLVLDTYGSYVTPDFGNIYGQIGVGINGGVIVNQGVIAVTGVKGLDIPNMGTETYLILIMSEKNGAILTWLNAEGIRAERNDPVNLAVVFIGQIYDDKGQPWFNVNPQIL